MSKSKKSVTRSYGSQVRVWDGADPRLLNRKHLLAEHREIHALLNHDFNWSTNPEYVRHRTLRGQSLLILRHELLRVAMAHRFGDHHFRDTHKTPVDTDIMSPRAHKALLLYEAHALPRRTPYPNAADVHAFFVRLMAIMAWPPCTLDGGANTPWARDGMTPAEYVRLGDRWMRAEHHIHHRKEPPHALHERNSPDGPAAYPGASLGFLRQKDPRGA